MLWCDAPLRTCKLLFYKMNIYNQSRQGSQYFLPRVCTAFSAFLISPNLYATYLGMTGTGRHPAVGCWRLAVKGWRLAVPCTPTTLGQCKEERNSNGSISEIFPPTYAYLTPLIDVGSLPGSNPPSIHRCKTKHEIPQIASHYGSR